MMLFVNSVSATAETEDLVTETETLTTTFETIQAERDVLEEQIKEVEKEIANLADSDKDREKAINDKIKLHMKDYKIAAKEAAYKKAIELEQPGYFGTTTTDSEAYSSTTSIPNLLLKGSAAPDEYMKYYVAASEKYNVDWSILAAIHSIETTFSTDLNISTAGAVGHMQFMPATWTSYGVDANGDGKKDPWNIADAIYAAAYYLKDHGFAKDQRKAIWHYNHADWYVNDVIDTAAMLRASS